MEPVYVTFEFKGNLEEEVQKVTLGIQGLRDESAKTYQRLIADSSAAFSAMSEANQKSAVSIQGNINTLRELSVVQKALDNELEAGTLSTNDYTAAKAALALQETTLRNTILQGIQALNERMQAESMASDSVMQMNKNLQDLMSTYNGLSKAEREGAQGQGLIKQIQTLQSEVTKANQALREQEQVDNAAADSVTRLNKRLQELVVSYNNLSKAQRDGAEGQAILNQIQDLDKEVGMAQSRLSQYSRMTGSSFNGLGMSIQQVARELPSLTMGANMFFLAISNNLPILADNIRAARIEYDLAKKSGQAAIPVWKQVLSSIISWQTAMVVGITLLVMYGKEIINWTSCLMKGGVAAQQAAETQKTLNELHKEATKSAAKETAQLQLLYGVTQDTTRTIEERTAAAKELQKLFPNYFGNLSTEIMLVGKAKTAYEALSKSIEETAKNKILNDKYAESVNKMSEAVNKRSEAEAKLLDLRSQLARQKEDNDIWNSNAPDIASTISSIELYERKLSKANKEIEAIKKSSADYLNAYKMNSTITPQVDILFKDMPESKKYLKTIEDINRSLSLSEITQDEYNKKLNDAKGELLKVADAAKIGGSELEKLRTEYVQFNKTKIAEKDTKKDTKEEDKAERIAQKQLIAVQKQLDATQKLSDKEKQIAYEKLQFEIDMEQKQIDLKEDSFQKRTRQAELDYEKELLAIQKYAADKLKTLQESERLEWEKGGKTGLFKPTTEELPQDELSRVAAMQEAAMATYRKMNDDITRDMDVALREERIRFASALQQKLSDIEQSYKERFAMAQGNESLISELTKNKEKEINQATSEHTRDLLKFYSDLTLQKMALSDKFYLFEADRRKAQLEVEKKAVQDSLNLMKAQYALAPTTELEQQIAASKVQLASFNKELDEMPVQRFGEALSIIKSVFNELSRLDGEIGEMFSGMASQIDNIWTAFDKSATTQDKISAGLNGLVSVINMVTSASKKRKETEQAFYKNAIALAHEYALALNEQLRLQSELSGSGFVTDYAGQIEDGFKAATDAQKKYDEAITKLNEGKAKVSLQNSVDWGNVGKGAAGGAAAGAAIGSVIPVIGTAIGAVVGAVGGFFAGLFGGKKKKETFGGLLEVFPELVDSAGNLNKELAQSIIDTDQVDDNTKQLIQNAMDWADAVEEANKQIKEIVVNLAGDLGNDMKSAIVDAWKAGEDASKNMFAAASKSLEGFIEDLLYSTVFSGIFDEFADRLAKSLDPIKGDGDVVDDYDWLMEQLDAKDEGYIAMLEAIKKRTAENGFDMWKEEGNRKATAKGLDSISQDSATELNGSFRMLIIYADKTCTGVTNIGLLLTQGLSVLNKIERNTSYCVRLEAIEGDISIMKKGIQAINDNGIILRKG